MVTSKPKSEKYIERVPQGVLLEKRVYKHGTPTECFRTAVLIGYPIIPQLDKYEPHN